MIKNSYVQFSVFLIRMYQLRLSCIWAGSY